ncbi:MAG: SDR family oxidoreductase [Candidatus Lokiarchaeota archaeon]|nr:SDR family oxidoreductase [Candidatus Lokiarchaeota archaeon]
MVITGSGRGIGRAVAIACAREGANVGLMSRTIEELNTLRDKIKNDYPDVKVVIAVADVTKIDDQTKAFTQYSEELGKLNGVIANAGWSRMGDSHEFDSDKFAAIININILGVFNTFKAAYPYLNTANKNNKARFITTGSAIYPNIMVKFAAYAASKFGVVGLQKELAIEYKGKNISFNMVLPTMVDTRLLRGSKAGDGNKPPGVMSPNELDDYYTFLLSEQANLINNQLIQTFDAQEAIKFLQKSSIDKTSDWDSIASFLQEKSPKSFEKVKGYGALLKFLYSRS